MADDARKDDGNRSDATKGEAKVDLEERILPITDAVTEGRLAVSLILKLVAELHRLGKLDEDEFLKVATTMIVELGSDQERFRAWGFFEEVIPDFQRPEQDKRDREDQDDQDDQDDRS